MANSSSELMEVSGVANPPPMTSTEDWSVQLRRLARFWEDSIHASMASTLTSLEQHLDALAAVNGVPDDVLTAVRQARLSIQGLDADTTEPGMLRQYLSSCLHELLARAASMRTRQNVVNLQHLPRVFVMDPRQNMAIACSIQLRAFGLNALSLLDETEFEKALSRWNPVAFIAVSEGLEEPEELARLLKHWRAEVGSHCFCVLLSANDTLQWRRVAAQSGFDLFAAGAHAHHQIGVHINAWTRQQQLQEQVLLLGSGQETESTRRIWESLGAEVAVIDDLNEAWAFIASRRPDSVLVDGTHVQRYPELPGLLRQLLEEQAIWILDQSLPVSVKGMQLLENRREAHAQAHLSLVRLKFLRLLQQETQRYDVESGLLTLEALFDRVLPALQSRTRDEQFLVCYVRFDGLEERLPVDDPLQRAYLRQNAAAALLARLTPGDWLGTVGDQNYLMVLRVGSERSLKTFSESLTHLPVAEGVTLKIGMAPVRGVHLARAIKDAVSGLHVPQKPEVTARQTAETASKPVAQDWSMRLKMAIQEKRLYLAFQSIVSLESEQIERYEVLLRLKEDGVSVEPREFIAIARQSGLIRYLDRWVVAEAIKTLRMRQAKIANTGLFIKVSTESVLDPGFLPWMQRVITAGHVSLEHSAIEVEENVFFSHVGEGKVFVEKMRELGVPVCIAQFGRSDASLNLIDYCSPEFIKLHRQYSEQLGQDKALDLRFNELVSRAKHAGSHLLVGYLESTQALYRAVQTGAPLVQGNVLHRPSKVMEFDYSIIMKE